MINDNDIWLRFCSGDKNAFKELYAQYYSLLFSWGCKWTVGNADIVKDTLHDFFIYLWEKKDGLSKNIQVSNYLLTSFKRALLNELKKNQKLNSLQELDLKQDEDAAADIALFTTQFNLVSKVLSNLSEAQREVVILRYIHQLSLQEIAQKKNSSIRTVYNLMHRALNKLKEEVGLVILLMFWK